MSAMYYYGYHDYVHFLYSYSHVTLTGDFFSYELIKQNDDEFHFCKMHAMPEQK